MSSVNSEVILTLLILGAFGYYLYINQKQKEEQKSISDQIVDDVKSIFDNIIDRGVGRIPDRKCPNSKVEYAGLCYSLPGPDWYVSAPGFIAKRCPPGWRDDGTTCWVDAETYGRGVGYPWQFGDGFNLNGAWSRCERDHGRGNCEQYGEVIYPKCREGFHASGCCLCTRDAIRQSKDVTSQVGTVPEQVCGGDEELIDGLCYKIKRVKR